MSKNNLEDNLKLLKQKCDIEYKIYEIVMEHKSKLNTIKEVTSLPVVVGFGISSKKSVSEIAKTSADGIVVGSALIKVMEQAKEKDLCPIDTVKNQMSVLRSGLL